MEPPETLEALQRSLLERIRDPYASADAEMLLPSPQQSVDERFSIYQTAYQARLIECMRELFPVLRMMLAEDFDGFAAEYVRHYPPSSYSLNHLADHFVDFLVETRPPRNETQLDWADVMIELARLEWQIDQVFDGPGSEHLPPLDTNRLSRLPPEAWLQTRLKPASCLRLFEFQFPINDYYTALKQQRSPELPAPAVSYLALTRRDYVVRRVSLEVAEFALLAALVTGKTIGEALESAAKESLLEPACVRDWFASWGRLGLFTGYD